ncbi:MAG: thiamine phosphate synthase [Burkholderiales bacterium]|nr:thiamine phosphate synthase [Burkholderiales bacterium]
MLPANEPVLRALSLPPVYAITQASRIGIETALQQIEQALHHGLRMIQIREKDMDSETLSAFSNKVIARAHEMEAQVFDEQRYGVARSVRCRWRAFDRFAINELV